MKEFFEFAGKGYEGTITFDPIERIVPIILTIIVIISLFIFSKKIKIHDEKIRKVYGYSLLVIWLSYYIWYIVHGKFGYQSLPISLCSFTSIGFVYVLLSNNKKVLDILFYWGILGGILAMVFASDIYRGVDNFRYYQFYLDHGYIVIAPFYYMAIHQYIPTLKSTIFSFIVLLIVALLTLPINLYYQMDYMIMNPYNPPLNTPASSIATLVNNNLVLYVGVLIILGFSVYMVVLLVIKGLLNLKDKFILKNSI